MYSNPGKRFSSLMAMLAASALLFSCATVTKDDTAHAVADSTTGRRAVGPEREKTESLAAVAPKQTEEHQSSDALQPTREAAPPAPPVPPSNSPTLSIGTAAGASPTSAARWDRKQGIVSGKSGAVRRGRVVQGEMTKSRSIAPEPNIDADEGAGYDTYDLITENEFLASERNPLSTFSIDVDAASYSNVRRFVKSGQMPPKDAVRIEELINYFHYDYPKPTGVDPFSITTESAVCPWAPEHRLVGIGLQGRTFDVAEIPPSNLVFLIDVSGSMNEPDKLPLLKSSLRLLVGQLRKQDVVSIVVYAGAAGEVLPATSGADKTRILEAIDNLEAGGSTAGGAGIQLAYATAVANYKKTGNNRVILATDGDFNVGMSSDAELIRLIEQKRESGVYLTVLGFGRGNLKDSRMEQLADKGNGHYAYIDGIAEARKVFGNEIGATLFTIAKDVKIQVEFNPAKVRGYRLIGYENRALAAEDFNNDRKDAGDLGAGHTVTALYEIVPDGAPLPDVKFTPVDSLKYQTSRIDPHAYGSDEIMTVKLRYKHPNDTVSKLITVPVKGGAKAFASASENLRFSAAVAGWGMLLRDSHYKGSATFDEIAKIARGAVGSDQFGYRKEFVTLVEQSAASAKTASR
jgi:Ca-activated chloride channel family protein